MPDAEGLKLVAGYAQAVGSDGEGPVLRNRLSVDALIDRPAGFGGQNLYDLFVHGGLQRWPTAPCFGSRVREDGSVGAYEWQTYQETSTRVDAVAAALCKLQLAPLTADGKRFLGFFLKNSRDWMVTCLACFKTAITVVPMYDTLGPDVVAFIQGQTGASTVLCSASELPTLMKNCPFRTVLLSGHAEPDKLEAARARGINIKRFAEVEHLGSRHTSLLASVSAPKPGDIALLCYTSGTTGDPKGAMISHANVLASAGNATVPEYAILSGAPDAAQEVHLSYLPLAHIFETVVMNLCLYYGAAIGFYQVERDRSLSPTLALTLTLTLTLALTLTLT